MGPIGGVPVDSHDVFLADVFNFPKPEHRIHITHRGPCMEYLPTFIIDLSQM